MNERLDSEATSANGIPGPGPIARLVGLGRRAVGGAAERVVLDALDVALRSRIVEAAVDHVLASGVTDRVAARIFDGPELERIAAAAVESPGVNRLADRVVNSPSAEQLVARVIESRLMDEAVVRLLESDDLWFLVDEIARSPSVTEAISHQGVGFADQMAGVVRERSRRADARLEHLARRLVRRSQDGDAKPPPGP